jgi:light-regulated signal transduction histidine kinase (bacteriophytochrome)
VDSPAFGQADLSNCERELIHLAGSVQPHGALLLLDGTDALTVLQPCSCLPLRPTVGVLADAVVQACAT